MENSGVGVGGSKTAAEKQQPDPAPGHILIQGVGELRISKASGELKGKGDITSHLILRGQILNPRPPSLLRDPSKQHFPLWISGNHNKLITTGKPP